MEKGLEALSEGVAVTAIEHLGADVDGIFSVDEDGDLSFNPMEPGVTALMFEKEEVSAPQSHSRRKAFGGTGGSLRNRV